MAAFTSPAVINRVVGTHEKVNILVDGICVVSQLAVAVPAEKQIAEDAFLRIFRLWSAALSI